MENVVILIGELEYTITPDGQVFKRRGKGFMKQTPDKDGYMKITSCTKNGTVNRIVHRLVYEAFVGPIPPGWTVDHIDDNKTNNHYKNLQVLTAVDNAIKGNAKHWVMVDPNGNVVEIYNMTQFCKDNGLHPTHMMYVCKGKPKYNAHKGWRKYHDA
jgi:hypothetical protein